MARIKTTLLIALFVLFNEGIFAQMMITTEAPEVTGLCDNMKVYALFNSMNGHAAAECRLSKEEIEKLLNEKVSFAKENPKFKGKGSLGVFISCKGDVAGWKISTESKSPELDTQVLEVFKTLNSWRAGSFNGERVDSKKLISYSLKKGLIRLD